MAPLGSSSPCGRQRPDATVATPFLCTKARPLRKLVPCTERGLDRSACSCLRWLGRCAMPPQRVGHRAAGRGTRLRVPSGSRLVMPYRSRYAATTARCRSHRWRSLPPSGGSPIRSTQGARWRTAVSASAWARASIRSRRSSSAARTSAGTGPRASGMSPAMRSGMPLPIGFAAASPPGGTARR